jgi:hypothetical protein
MTSMKAGKCYGIPYASICKTVTINYFIISVIQFKKNWSEE